MSSPIDPAKLKVVELRNELSARGLDTKGNKPILVKRLKEALEKELQEELPDTSLADTSTEDLSSSELAADDSQEEDKSQSANEEQPKAEEPMEVNSTEQVTQVSDEAEPQITKESEQEEEKQQEETSSSVENVENGGDHENVDKGEDVEKVEESVEEKPKEADEAVGENGQTKEDAEPEPRGDKRKRESPSPERSSRKRSRSPIREDEPTIDNDKVQLNWYDSDLHLQVDKESFLSAKPYHDGAFGYAWAGARATHGVTKGKVYYEVKITEELKWEDIVRQYDRSNSNNSSKRGHERSRRDSRDSKRDDKKEKPTTEGEAEKQMEVDESNDNKTNENSDDNKTEDKPEEKDEAKATETVEDENKEVKEGDDEKKSQVETVEEKEKEEKMEVDEPKADPVPSHLFRVGWSLLNTGLQLGEYQHSYAYESSGKFVTNKTFEEYGVKFGVGDVIGSFLNITDEDVTITYTVNGAPQPTAATIERSEFSEDDFALFPHVLSRNCAFEFNLGSREEPWFAPPPEFEEYVPLEKAEDKVVGPLRPESRGDCEVILMCGLPGAGKTHWVKEWVAKNPEKKYTVIGNTHFLERMTVNGGPLKSCYKGRWSLILDKLQKCLNQLVEVAALRRRNYIIDQTNVFLWAQRRKLRLFEGFKRRAVVVVVGDEEYAKRRAMQEAQDGKDVPDTAVLEMKATMGLPRAGDWVDEVIYSDLGEEEAKAIVDKYNNEGRDAGFGSNQRRDFKNDRRRDWYNNRRQDYRGGNYRDKGYYNRYDNRGPPRGGWHHSPRGYRGDRRDHRGPPPRDWRNNRGSGRPDNRDSSRSQGSSYNRNRDGSSGGRSRGGSWQGGSSGYGGQGWSQGGGGSWGQGGWQQGNWSGQQQQQPQQQGGWKYGGQGYQGGYGGSYYGGQ